MTTPTAMVPHIEEAPASGVAQQDPVAMFMQQSETVIDDRNWALDETVYAYIRDNIMAVLEQTRLDMSSIHEEWRQVARMGALIHDDWQRYRGRSNAYIPGWARAK